MFLYNNHNNKIRSANAVAIKDCIMVAVCGHRESKVDRIKGRSGKYYRRSFYAIDANIANYSKVLIPFGWRGRFHGEFAGAGAYFGGSSRLTSPNGRHNRTVLVTRPVERRVVSADRVDNTVDADITHICTRASR